MTKPPNFLLIFFFQNFFPSSSTNVKIPETINIEKLLKDFMTFLKFYDAWWVSHPHFFLIFHVGKISAKEPDFNSLW